MINPGLTEKSTDVLGTAINPATSDNQTNGSQVTQLSTNNPVGDAFGRLRVSLPNSLFDAQFTYDLQPLLFERVTAEANATITYDATNRMALMTFASTPINGKAFMQSHEYFRYRAGHSQLAYITFNMIEGVADVMKFAGYSDGVNGIEFQLNGTTKQFTVYSDTTTGDETVIQADWNVDKLDGTGASGITLDVTKTQILVIDFQALYVGRVRVGFDMHGVVVWVHEFQHANMDASPYFQSANLPVRCGMTSSATVSTTMNFICSTVQSESGETLREGFQFTQGANVLAASGALTHLISIQPKLTFNSITNRTKIVIDSIELTVTGNNPVEYYLVLGDAITGTTDFIDENTTYSAVQYNILGTTSGAPAITILSGYIPSTAQSKGAISQSVATKYPITLDVAGNARLLGRISLLILGVGGTSQTRGTINWTEIR